MDGKYQNKNQPNPTKSAVTVPLISPSNVPVNMGRSCWTRKDVSMTKLTSCRRIFIIILGIVLAISCLYCIIISIIIGYQFYIVYVSQFLNLAYGIFISISFLRIKWIRITSTTLSIIFVFLGSGSTFLEMLIIDDRSSDYKGLMGSYSLFCFIRIGWLHLITNILLYYYWGFNICKEKFGKRRRGRRRRHKARRHHGKKH